MLGRKRVNEALALMGEMFPNAHGELEWETPFQLLVAVILSAQTTDKAVNKVFCLQTLGIFETIGSKISLGTSKKFADVRNHLRKVSKNTLFSIE